MTAKPAKSHAHGDSSREGERRPLLSARSSSGGSDAATLPPDSGPEPAQKWTRRSILIVVMCFVVVTFFPCTDAVLDVGLLEILEGILCRKRHGSMPDPTTDPRCKDSAVQGEMANLLAISFTLGVLPGLTAVTWGVVAEKYGRKPVMLLSVSAIFLNNVMNLGIYWFSDYISVYWMWLTAFINFFGGGPAVFSAMAFTMISEVVPKSQRATVYLYVGAGPTLGIILSGPLAYVYMGLGHWFTAGMGLLGYVIVISVTMCIPETIVENKHAGEELVAGPDDAEDTGRLTRIWHSVVSAFLNTIQSLRVVFLQDKKLGLLVLGSLFADLGTSLFNLLMQYATKRLNLQYREANLLISSTTVSKLVIVLALLPILSQFVLKYNVKPIKKDMWIARISILLVSIGNFGLGLSNHVATFVPSLVMYNMYTAYLAALRSVVTEIAGESKLAVVFSTMGLLDSLGMLVAGPVMAQAYSLGLRLGGDWQGLPFYISGGLVAIVAVMMWSSQISNHEKGEEEQE
ncbi:hypothetical protein K4F52_002988 [Lecanicillium sp. MT-2017a]|nr:hypothetical protein K4F52_002988 [Lecanicillium sp. MT-2017a]